MFSPDMFRYILDPDKSTDESVEIPKLCVEKQPFRYSTFDHEKILTDYSFFSKTFKGFGKVFKLFAFESR